MQSSQQIVCAGDSTLQDLVFSSTRSNPDEVIYLFQERADQRKNFDVWIDSQLVSDERPSHDASHSLAIPTSASVRAYPPPDYTI